MGFKRRLSSVASQILIFACGVGWLLAMQAGFYACAMVLLLIAAWRTVVAVQPNWPAAQLSASPPASAAEVEQRLLVSLLDQTPAPLLTRRADGVIRAGNRAARLLFRTDDRLLAPPHALVGALSSSPAELTTFTLPGREGPRVYAVSITDLADPRGGLRIAVLIDIQPELRAAEAAALRDLLQVLSHEIMNALTPVASLASTAMDLLDDDQPASTRLARDALDTLARRAAGLARFVEAYRTLARLPPPDLQPTRVAAVIDEAASLFQSRWSGQAVTLRLQGEIGDAVAPLDRDLMIHALMNVLSNAAEASLQTGRPPTVALTVGVEASRITLCIADNGAGVPPELSGQVFRPFFTTKPQGTGVGLSFARQVALSHGGDLVLAAPDGSAGARFTFFIDR